MNKRGWSKLRKKQQPHEDTLFHLSHNDGAYQVHTCYNDVGSLGQQHLNKNPPNNTVISTLSSNSSPLSTASSPSPLRHCNILPADQTNSIRTSKLLRIARQWKALSKRSPSHPASTSSSPRSMLNFVPLGCFGSSSSADLEEEEDVDDIPSDSTCLKNPKVPNSSPLHSQAPRSSAKAWPRAADWPQSSCHSQYTGKKHVDSSCESEMPPVPRRSISCPKLSKSPLRSCTPSPVYTRSKHAQEDDDSKTLHLKKQNAAGSHSAGRKLRRSLSSPLRKFNASKPASTPKGYLALYVGKDRKRFVVKANVVNHPMFSVLLEKAKEEFGFEQKGALNIPCDIAFFKHIMLLVESNQRS